MRKSRGACDPGKTRSPGAAQGRATLITRFRQASAWRARQPSRTNASPGEPATAGSRRRHACHYRSLIHLSRGTREAFSRVPPQSFSSCSYGRGGGVGCGLCVGLGLGGTVGVDVGVGVGVCVAVAVAVGVAVGVCVAVAVAVGVAVGVCVAVAVAVGVAVGVCVAVAVAVGVAVGVCVAVAVAVGVAVGVCVAVAVAVGVAVGV